MNAFLRYMKYGARIHSDSRLECRFGQWICTAGAHDLTRSRSLVANFGRGRRGGVVVFVWDSCLWSWCISVSGSFCLELEFVLKISFSDVTCADLSFSVPLFPKQVWAVALGAPATIHVKGPYRRVLRHPFIPGGRQCSGTVGTALQD
jgi:hypothetical protein